MAVIVEMDPDERNIFAHVVAIKPRGVAPLTCAGNRHTGDITRYQLGYACMYFQLFHAIFFANFVRTYSV